MQGLKGLQSRILLCKFNLVWQYCKILLFVGHSGVVKIHMDNNHQSCLLKQLSQTNNNVEAMYTLNIQR